MAPTENNKSILDDLRIATPCSASWEQMASTDVDAVRFCGQCSKNVYDVSGMSKAEAELLIQQGSAAGSLPCMRLYMRQDGTVITDDCPVGLRRIRDFWRKAQSTAAAVAALLMVALPALAQNKTVKQTEDVVKEDTPARMKMGRICPVKAAPQAMLGSPPVIDWRVEAMKSPAVKSIADRIEALKKSGNLSAEETVKVLRLRLEMAQIAEKNNVPNFATQELAELNAAATKNAEAKALLPDILKAQIANAKKLKLSDTILKEQLQKLQSEK